MTSVVISASMVKELRERTNSGMMECKKALVEANGNIEEAIEAMRKAGTAKAAKKAGRVAAEGVIVIRVSVDGKHAVMVEVNSETDFVGRGEPLKAFAENVAEAALAHKASDAAAAATLVFPGTQHTVEEERQALVVKVGENIHIRRVVLLNTTGILVSYLHGSRIGVVVALNGGNEELGRDIAMHIAAVKPEVVLPEQVPASSIEKEREIFIAQARESGKPDDIIKKMVEGRIQKFLNEISLVGQPFVKDPQKTVSQVLKAHNATVTAFERFEVGEGIEKKTDNFVDEVMAQVRGA